MNIFILDNDIKQSAICHTDKHIVKMPTELAQMLSFVYHDTALWDKDIPAFIMKNSKTHYKHPCSIWIRESLSNFKYAATLGFELWVEYQYRYNDISKHLRAIEIFDFALNNPPNIADIGLTKFALAMDDTYIISDCPLECYRNYYNVGKKHLHSWKNRNIPDWINQ